MNLNFVTYRILEDVDIYFVYLYLFHKRETNENFNSLLRETPSKKQPCNSLAKQGIRTVYRKYQRET